VPAPICRKKTVCHGSRPFLVVP